MHEDIGLNFATALRAFLRQDPNIIMVGEIRDFETAEIAVKAALTGHLVLSTLHTNDAPSTVSRLLNMGVEPFLVTASVNLVLAQRLARKICADCKSADREAPRGAREDGHDRGADRAARKIMKGTRLQHLQQHRLQGPRRALRGHAVHRSAQGAGAPGRVGGRAQGRDDPRRHAERCAWPASQKILEGVTTPEEVLRTTVDD